MNALVRFRDRGAESVPFTMPNAGGSWVQPPNVQTCTRAPERKRFVYFQHRIAAQALLADMLGDVPTLIAVHNADQLRGLDAREPGTWVEVVGHPHMIPDNIWHAACDAGLLRLWLSDSNRREKFQRDMTGAVREAAKVFPPRPVSPWVPKW